MPDEANSRVYAAATGTIVAARFGIIGEPERQQGESEHEDGQQEEQQGRQGSATEANPINNSIGFVLIKHAVYDTITGQGDARRFNYDGTEPKTVFSLYMHLAPLPVDSQGNTIDIGRDSEEFQFDMQSQSDFR